ncbi:MAG: HAMP domain-containing protein [Deinococcus sp.]|nr:HAMP domain-containing protein [Deinococcus sp.]
MKYTVVIQHPVQDEVRAELERQLSQRLGLSASAAGKLAGRRSGRLLKPTTRSKAEKLLSIFSAVGATVSLEEVPEEGELSVSGLGGTAGLSVPAAAPVPGTGAATDAGPVNADPFGVSAGKPPISADPFGTDPLSAAPFAADPFGGAPLGSDSFGGASSAETAGRTQVLSAAPGRVTLPPASADQASADQADAATRTSKTTAPKAEADEWASFAQSLGGADASPDGRRADTGQDVWADFADTLKVDVPVQAQPGMDAGPAPLTSSFMDEDAGALPLVSGPRRPMERRLLLTTMLPTATLSLLTLLTLLVAVPAGERQQESARAQTLASSISTLMASADAATIQNRLGTLALDSGIGFVEVELPNKTTYFASNLPEDDRKTLQDAFTQWRARSEGGNTLQVGRTYAVGQSKAGDTTAPRVTVGVPYQVDLARVVIPWLLTTLLLLGLTALWARRAAQALLIPIQRLVRSADAISSGDLSQPVRAEGNDELGDLAQALERMRLSLSAAMDRLRRRKR